MVFVLLKTKVAEMALRTRVELALEGGALLYSVEELSDLLPLNIPQHVEAIPFTKLVIGTLLTIPNHEDGSTRKYRIIDIRTYLEELPEPDHNHDFSAHLHLIYIVEPAN